MVPAKFAPLLFSFFVIISGRLVLVLDALVMATLNDKSYAKQLASGMIALGNQDQFV